jgi:hypothetical protein
VEEEDEEKDKGLPGIHFLVHDTQCGSNAGTTWVLENSENGNIYGPNIYDPSNQTWQWTVPYDPLDRDNPPVWILKDKRTGAVALDPMGNPINWLQLHLEKNKNGEWDESTVWGQSEAWLGGECPALVAQPVRWCFEIGLELCR